MELTECKYYETCEYRKGVGECPEDCNHYRHKDEVVVVRCRDCEFKGNTEACPLLSIADYTEANDYCSVGERRTTYDQTLGKQIRPS